MKALCSHSLYMDLVNWLVYWGPMIAESQHPGMSYVSDHQDSICLNVSVDILDDSQFQLFHLVL